MLYFACLIEKDHVPFTLSGYDIGKTQQVIRDAEKSQKGVFHFVAAFPEPSLLRLAELSGWQGGLP